MQSLMPTPPVPPLESDQENLLCLQKLSRDVKKAAAELTDTQARYLVDTYYQLQNYRIRAGNQRLAQKEEPHVIVTWQFQQMLLLENEMKKVLQTYAESRPVGRWLLSVCGIGPVIAAGLLAHIDVEKVNYAGNIWRYAGLDPTVEWNAKQKRPWNAKLKVLAAFKAGESFVKVQNNPNDVYGKIFRERKTLEQQRNERLEFADQAKAKLEKFRIGKDTEAYKWYTQGKLPPAHIHARARRYAVKIFLSHLAQVMYEEKHGKPFAKPWIIEHGGHRDFLPPPNWTSPAA